MILNHLKISFRSLVAQRGYSLINILGLAVGIASALLIMLYVIDEFSYDRFHPNSSNIYRICLDAWYLMKSWLDNFVFRIELSLLSFIVASLVSYLIAVLTVGYQALRAAGANPAITLKYE